MTELLGPEASVRPGPPSFGKRLAAALARGIALAKRVYRVFDESNGLLHAGGIAFFGILSILPFSLLAVSLVARILARMPMEFEQTVGADAIMTRLRHAIPFLDDKLGDLIATLAARPAPLGILSVLTLVYAASAGFNAASDGVNAALGTERQRRFFVTKLLVAALVILSIGGLLLWSTLINVLAAVAAQVDVALPRWLLTGSAVEFLVELVTLAAGHTLIVRVMATERCPPRVRWLGSFAFAGCFTVARMVLGLYLSEIATYDQYYGPAGAFVGLNLWMYVVSILLIGSCVLIRVLSEARPEPS